MALPITNPNPPVSSSGNRNIPYRIETINLSYKILGESTLFQAGGSSTRGSKFILKNVNCEANAGEMTAIVGPSGAGKTTLLEILGGKASEKNISGRVLVNDQPVNDKRFQRILGYVTQDDALFPLLTVEETLMYSALLRLHGLEIETKVSRVRELVKELGLEKVAASKIGRGSNWGISGGERRRVSIGIDLVHDPPVILIDEPTSGLDSVSALHVISVLKRMTANQGKTIVLTIHQPGFRIIQLFDRLVLLSNGFVVHNDSLNCLEERLRLAGHIIPHHVNALEYSMDVLDSLAVHSPAVSLQNPSFQFLQLCLVLLGNNLTSFLPLVQNFG